MKGKSRLCGNSSETLRHSHFPYETEFQSTDLDIGYSRRSSMAGTFIGTKPRRSVSFDEDAVYATHCSTQSKATLCSKGSTASDDSGMGSGWFILLLLLPPPPPPPQIVLKFRFIIALVFVHLSTISFAE